MSDVPEGYKMSEVGVIPEGWEVKTFGEVMTGFSSGATPYRGRPEYYKGNIRWITSGELNYNVITDTIEKITENAVRNTNLKIHPKGTFLMAITGLEAEGTRGSCGIVGAKATTNQSCMALFPTKELLTEYLFQYYINYGNSLALEYCQGTKQQSYTAKIVKILPIIVPPTIEEQQAIASALSDVDALITALEQLITKKRNIKQGAMQQLLTGEKRLLGFGGEWDVKKLEEFGEFYKGKGLPKSEITTNGKYKCIHYGELFTIYNEEIKKVVSRTDKKDNFFLSRANDVLMPTSDVTPNGLATASCINESEVILGGDVLVIRALVDVLDGIFLSYGITQNKKQIMQLVSGSTVYHLYGSDMKKYQFSIPPTKEEQTAIATILSDMDTEIESLEQKQAKYKAIKQGMMQELLTGKTRLV
jgi:type I restriction enzyme S subunit